MIDIFMSFLICFNRSELMTLRDGVPSLHCLTAGNNVHSLFQCIINENKNLLTFQKIYIILIILQSIYKPINAREAELSENLILKVKP